MNKPFPLKLLTARILLREELIAATIIAYESFGTSHAKYSFAHPAQQAAGRSPALV